jgi:hypothetical protein
VGSGAPADHSSCNVWSQIASSACYHRSSGGHQAAEACGCRCSRSIPDDPSKRSGDFGMHKGGADMSRHHITAPVLDLIMCVRHLMFPTLGTLPIALWNSRLFPGERFRNFSLRRRLKRTQHQYARILGTTGTGCWQFAQCRNLRQESSLLPQRSVRRASACGSIQEHGADLEFNRNPTVIQGAELWPNVRRISHSKTPNELSR